MKKFFVAAVMAMMMVATASSMTVFGYWSNGQGNKTSGFNFQDIVTRTTDMDKPINPTGTMSYADLKMVAKAYWNDIKDRTPDVFKNGVYLWTINGDEQNFIASYCNDGTRHYIMFVVSMTAEEYAWAKQQNMEDYK